MTPLDLRERRDGPVMVVTLAGGLDSTTSPEVRARLHGLVARGDRVLVDLSQVQRVTSAGLRTVLLLHRHAQSMGAAIALTGISESVRAVLTSTGFLTWIVAVDSVADGVRELTARQVRS